MTATSSIVDQILARWPLASMCARLGIELPARGKFKSPWRPDNTPSCEVYQETIRDRSTGETYDSIRVFAESKGITNSEAIKTLAAELPGNQQRPDRTVKPDHKLVIPAGVTSRKLCEELGTLRKLPAQAVEAASMCLGMVSFVRVCGHRCWLITDGKYIAEARRLDGQPFDAYMSLGERKAHTIKGSRKAWPVGLEPKQKPPASMSIVLGEGSPDYLALCAVALEAKPEFLPVVMLGSGSRIDPAALPMFAGRTVTILAHPDDAGKEAACRWAKQIATHAASVRVVHLIGGDVNDIVSEITAKTFAEEIL